MHTKAALGLVVLLLLAGCSMPVTQSSSENDLVIHCEKIQTWDTYASNYEDIKLRYADGEHSRSIPLSKHSEFDLKMQSKSGQLLTARIVTPSGKEYTREAVKQFKAHGVSEEAGELKIFYENSGTISSTETKIVEEARGELLTSDSVYAYTFNDMLEGEQVKYNILFSDTATAGVSIFHDGSEIYHDSGSEISGTFTTPEQGRYVLRITNDGGEGVASNMTVKKIELNPQPLVVDMDLRYDKESPEEICQKVPKDAIDGDNSK